MFNNVGGLADVDNVKSELEFWHGPNTDNDRIRDVIRKYIVPYVKAMLPEFKAEAKLAIQYLLTFTPEAAERVLPSILATFPPPDPASLMFEWIWEETFPNESWRLPGQISDYEAVYDFEQTNRLQISDEAQVPSPYVGEGFHAYGRNLT